MPRVSFLPRVNRMGVSLQTATQLALEYQVSRTAALVHMALTASTQLAVVLWRWKLKPTELRARAESTKRLRVEWVISNSKRHYIPKDQSLPDDSIIVAAARDGQPTQGTEQLMLGRNQGLYRSENWPFLADGEWQVLSLLYLLGHLIQP